MGVGLAIIAGQYCGRYISCDKVFPDSRGPGFPGSRIPGVPDSRGPGNPTGSAQCAGSGNGSSRHTVVPLCDDPSSVWKSRLIRSVIRSSRMMCPSSRGSTKWREDDEEEEDMLTVMDKWNGENQKGG